MFFNTLKNIKRTYGSSHWEKHTVGVSTKADEKIFILETISSDSYDDENVVFTVKREEKIGNYKAIKEYKLDYEDIKNAINDDLKEHGYQVHYFNCRTINKKILGIDVFINKLEW